MKDYVPRPWQPHMIDWVLDRPRCALFAGMGLGKGSVALTALSHLSMVEDPFPALVLGPLRVARKVWTEEVQKWKHLAGLRVSRMIGTPEERSAGRRTAAEVYTINYENLPWLLEQCRDHWPFRTVIADESTKLKNFRFKQGGVRAQALGKVAHKHVNRWINLTGTPSPNGLKDLWGQTWFLDEGLRLGRTYSGFEQRWFAYKRVQDAITKKPGIVPVIMPWADRDIHERISDLCLSVNIADWVDIDEPVHNVIRVDLPPKVKSLYRSMERDMFMQIKTFDIEAVNAAAKTIKCLQLANGAVYVDPNTEHDEQTKARQFEEVHNAKLEALQDIVEEASGMPVLVAYQFKSDLARLLKAFPDGRALRTEQDEDDFKAGQIPVLFAHPDSAGHGIDGFQNVTNIIAFFGHWWNLETRQQMIERIGPVRQMQSGFKRPVFIHDIVAEGTVDELVLARHATKRGVQDLLLDYLKAKGLK